MNDELKKMLHPCGCKLTDDGKMIVCAMHYNEMKKNSEVKPIKDLENTSIIPKWGIENPWGIAKD